MRRTLPLLLLAVLLLSSVGNGDDPVPEGGNAPLRLKRKNRGTPPPAPEPAKKDGEKPAEKAKEPDDKDKPAEEEPLKPEDGRPAEPDEDEQEVLERIGRNMRAVEEKLGSRELGDRTRQQQQDILRDLDALIKKSEAGQSGGGANQPQQQAGNRDQDRQQAREQGNKGQAQGSRAQRQRRSDSRSQRAARPQRERGPKGEKGSKEDRAQARSGAPKEPGGSAGRPPLPGQPRPAGMQPGQGGTGPDKVPEINVEEYKDVWGHLPEALRAEMNAYSNPQPFLPRYDRLIREYYKTIATQGRKKGD